MSTSLPALLIYIGLTIPNAYSETPDVCAFYTSVLTNCPSIHSNQCFCRPGTEHLQARLQALEKKEKLNEKKSAAFAAFEAKQQEINQKYLPLLKTGCKKVSRNDAKVWNGNGGIFDIYQNGHSIEVYCDQTTDGGGWLVFQRRMDGSVDFYRDWNDYVNGFGNLDGEFWLGLQTIHLLTSNANYELRVDLEDWEGNKRYATYSTFHVGNALSTYTLKVDGYAGNAGDSLARQNGMKFSTKDKDSDTWPRNCASVFRGAWWYGACHNSNLNGHYFPGGPHKSHADGIEWFTWKGYYYSLKAAEMKIRKL